MFYGDGPGVPSPQGLSYTRDCLLSQEAAGPHTWLSHCEDWASEVGELQILDGAPHSLWLTVLSCLLGSTPAPLQSALRSVLGGL